MSIKRGKPGLLDKVRSILHGKKPEQIRERPMVFFFKKSARIDWTCNRVTGGPRWLTRNYHMYFTVYVRALHSCTHPEYQNDALLWFVWPPTCRCVLQPPAPLPARALHPAVSGILSICAAWSDERRCLTTTTTTPPLRQGVGQGEDAAEDDGAPILRPTPPRHPRPARTRRRCSSCVIPHGSDTPGMHKLGRAAAVTQGGQGSDVGLLGDFCASRDLRLLRCDQDDKQLSSGSYAVPAPWQILGGSRWNRMMFTPGEWHWAATRVLSVAQTYSIDKVGVFGAWFHSYC
ncbi:hypothetical protein C8J57DRAFT_1475038 [Mycena rebaudengoi]|nr:hypothetical protein C8J57DRAFT_1475038 [Mycena rebaudengoi]